MQLLEGKVASSAIKEDLKNKISDISNSQGKKIPHLAAILGWQ